MGSQGDDPDFDVVVIGGGFCGCWALHDARKRGFKAHMYEAGSALGGIWHWNTYPGARVDTPAPTYQLTATETWDTWNWKQKFPGGEELKEYFRNLDKVWDLSKDITYDTRITSMRWDSVKSRWRCNLNGSTETVTAWSVVLCTGFASKLYTPPYKNLDRYEGVIHHTAAWPRSGVELKDKRVAVIGTGASGVQAIQEIAKVAKHMTVYQRTPNTALPMQNPDQTPEVNQAMRASFPETAEKMRKTFAGFDYEFNFSKPSDLSEEERMAFYDQLYTTGGLHFWLGTYMNVLFEPEANEEAYQYWRAKTLPRIKDPKVAEILAPEQKIHPFGTKRISLEDHYFEIFNQDNVDLIDVRANPIAEFTSTGITTSNNEQQQQQTRDFDVIVLATGFDSITGGITQIDIRGTDPDLSIEDKWRHGTYTNLGMTTNGFPNLFFTYGPQAPTAFATGPSNAETQGEWIVTCLEYLREKGYASIDATPEAEKEWRVHVNEVAEKSLFPEAESWYFGANIPGKAREALNYMGGLPLYREKCWGSAKNGYAGFTLTR